MEKAQRLELIANGLITLADDDLIDEDMSVMDLRSIVENNSPMGAASVSYLCGMTMGARIERNHPGEAELYNVKEITAAEYRKTSEAAEPPDPETEADEDQEILALMFNDAIDKLHNGTFDIDQDLQFLKRMNGITGK